MINRDDIEAGDKCYTRDGGCLVARQVEGFIKLLNYEKGAWHQDGSWNGTTHPLDIIRIEKAPKPVVSKVMFGSDDGEDWALIITSRIESWKHVISFTTINGKMDKWEQVK